MADRVAVENRCKPAIRHRRQEFEDVFEHRSGRRDLKQEQLKDRDCKHRRKAAS
jgi:hypothetical protein